MREWLVFAAFVPIVSATAAQAQMKGLNPGVVAEVARTRALDLRLNQEQGAARPSPLVLRGMLISRDVAPNALVGLGLANTYTRKKLGSNARGEDRPSRSRKPAVTFVLKF
jgi:hypothetical protein